MGAVLNPFTGQIDLTGSTITPSSTITVGNIIDNGLTPNTALAADGSKQIVSSATTATQLGYLSTTTSDVQTQLNATEKTANKGAASGYAPLDSASKIPLAYLPASILEFQGSWNASTNTPHLVDGTGVNGYFYRVSVGGTQNLGSGPQTFVVGDFVIYDGSIWELSHGGADAVQSVNGYTGVVNLTTSDIPEGTHLYFTGVRAEAAVGGILANSSKVSLTYNAGTPSITADIIAGSLVNADINASAGINATKLADGSVSNTQLEALNTVTSNVQTQLNGTVLLAGRTGGQTINGDTASGGNLTLSSTANATKGKILFGSDNAYDEVNDRLGLGTASPTGRLHVKNVNDVIVGNLLLEGQGTGASRLWALYASPTGNCLLYNTLQNNYAFSAIGLTGQLGLMNGNPGALNAGVAITSNTGRTADTTLVLAPTGGQTAPFISAVSSPTGGGTRLFGVDLDGTILANNLTTSTAIYADSNKKLQSSATTATQLGYLSTTTSDIQTQLNSKVTASGFTSGSVIFSNGTNLTQDNNNFFWDNTNKRLGLGINSPQYALHVKNTVNGLAGGLCLSGSAGASSDWLLYASSSGFFVLYNPDTSTYSLAADQFYRNTFGPYGVGSTNSTLGVKNQAGYDYDNVRLVKQTGQTNNFLTCADVDYTTVLAKIDISGNITGANLSGTNTGDISLGAIGSSPSATGASLSGQILTLEPADGTHPGIVTTGSQTFAGSKTFSTTPVFSSLSNGIIQSSSGSLNPITIGSGLTFSGGTLSASASSTAINALYYVATNGNDSTGDGSISKPYLTIQAAINAASSAGYNYSNQAEILVLPSSSAYATFTTKNGINVHGIGSGFDNQTVKVQNIVVTPDSGGTAGNNSVRLSNLTIDATGTGAHAISLTGSDATSLFITGCQIIADSGSNGIAVRLNQSGSSVNVLSSGVSGGNTTNGLIYANSGTMYLDDVNAASSFIVINAGSSGSISARNCSFTSSGSGSAYGAGANQGTSQYLNCKFVQNNSSAGYSAFGALSGTATLSGCYLKASGSADNLNVAFGATINQSVLTFAGSSITVTNAGTINNLPVYNTVVPTIGDIAQTSFTAVDNQSSAADITGFVFTNASVRSFEAQVSIVRGSTYANYQIIGIQKAASWEISQSRVGDDTGITFSITAGGQLQYTSTSTGSTATLKFRAEVTNV